MIAQLSVTASLVLRDQGLSPCRDRRQDAICIAGELESTWGFLRTESQRCMQLYLHHSRGENSQHQIVWTGNSLQHLRRGMNVCLAALPGQHGCVLTVNLDYARVDRRIHMIKNDLCDVQFISAFNAIHTPPAEATSVSRREARRGDDRTR